jgi:hypothetical protein
MLTGIPAYCHDSQVTLRSASIRLLLSLSPTLRRIYSSLSPQCVWPHWDTQCLKCHNDGIKWTVKDDNPNGNAGRPFYKCDSCSRFICFDDQRGISCANPICDCGQYSRRQMSGVRKQFPRRLHYVCAPGGCDFYGPMLDNGRQCYIPEQLVHFSIATSFV